MLTSKFNKIQLFKQYLHVNHTPQKGVIITGLNETEYSCKERLNGITKALFKLHTLCKRPQGTINKLIIKTHKTVADTNHHKTVLK